MLNLQSTKISIHYLKENTLKMSLTKHLQNMVKVWYDDLRTNFHELKWLEFYGVLSAVKSLMRKRHSTPMRDKDIEKGLTLTEILSRRKVNNFQYFSSREKNSLTPASGAKESGLGTFVFRMTTM